MEAVIFLERPGDLKAEIQSDADNLAALRSVMEKVTTSLSFTAGCNPSKETHAFEDIMLSIKMEEEKIWGKVELLKEVLLETAEVINRLSSEKERRLLKLRYLEGKSWYEVAAVLQINDHYVHAIHRSALKHMEGLLSETP